MLEVRLVSIGVTWEPSIENDQTIVSANIEDAFAVGIGSRVGLSAPARRDVTCCQEDIEVGGNWQVSYIEVLPFSHFRIGESIISMTSSGIEISNHNDLTNCSKFGIVRTEGIEMGSSIQVAVFVFEVS
jgi:hypothetical protein